MVQHRRYGVAGSQLYQMEEQLGQAEGSGRSKCGSLITETVLRGDECKRNSYMNVVLVRGYGLDTDARETEIYAEFINIKVKTPSGRALLTFACILSPNWIYLRAIL